MIMSKSKTDIKKLMQLDIEAGESPSPENLSRIFEAAMVEKKVEPEFLSQYLHSIRPGLEDLSLAFKQLAEKNRHSISADALETISEGLDLMLLPDTELPAEESEKIYDRMVELVAKDSGHEDLEKHLLHSLLIIGGTLLTAAAIPHIMNRSDDYGKQAKKLFGWIHSLFSD
jgi:hypothetical protein